MSHPGDLLSAYLDERLIGSERSAVDAHLGECPKCRAELVAAREGRQLVRSLSVLEPPPGVFDLPAEVLPRRRPRVRRMLAAAAISALIVGVGLGVSADRAVPLPLDEVVEQHVARASVDRGLNVLQVQAVVNR
jgi:anti-sigma factor RsiW